MENKRLARVPPGGLGGEQKGWFLFSGVGVWIYETKVVKVQDSDT